MLPPRSAEGLHPPSAAPSSSLHSPGNPNPSHQDHPCSLFPWEYARHHHPLSPEPTQSRCARGLSRAAVSGRPASKGMSWVSGRRERRVLKK